MVFLPSGNRTPCIGLDLGFSPPCLQLSKSDKLVAHGLLVKLVCLDPGFSPPCPQLTKSDYVGLLD